jgi:hypothetical protein
MRIPNIELEYWYAQPTKLIHMLADSLTAEDLRIHVLHQLFCLVDLLQ